MDYKYLQECERFKSSVRSKPKATQDGELKICGKYTCCLVKLFNLDENQMIRGV